MAIVNRNQISALAAPSARVVGIDHVHLAMVGGDFEVPLVTAEDGAENLARLAIDDPDLLPAACSPETGDPLYRPSSAWDRAA